MILVIRDGKMVTPCEMCKHHLEYLSILQRFQSHSMLRFRRIESADNLAESMEKDIY